MKKLFLISLVCLSMLLVGCSKFVKKIEETPKSYGKDITFHTVDANNNYTFYTLIVPDSAYLGNPKFYIRYWPKDAKEAESVKTYENAVIGEVVKKNGEIKSIVINDTKYVDELK